MAAMSRIQVRTENELKEKADSVFHAMGMDMGTAVNMFLAQTVNEQRLPFQPSVLTPFEKSVLDTEAEPVIHGGDAKAMKELIERV